MLDSNTFLKPEFAHTFAQVFDEAIFRYMLHPEESSEDEYHLLMNGSIFAPRIDHVPIMLMPGKDYCMEFVPTQGLRALVCFQGLYRRT